MNIILLAPPAAGKGTESKKLEYDYSIPHISTGDLLRKAIANNDSLSKEINDDIKNGDFVRDEIVIRLIESRIANDDCKNGYILDGFPRNITQAKIYDKIIMKNSLNKDYVFVIDMDKETAKSRIIGRRSCPKCGRVYNITYEQLTPKIENMCDDCGSALIKRADDNAVTFEERYELYLKETAPLIEYYESRNIAFHIDGNVNKDYTHKQIKEILDK